MPIKPMPSSSSYEPMPSGTFAARLYSVIHIGTVPSEYQGQKKFVDKVRLSFEFPTKKKVFNEEKGEQPYVLHSTFTLSTHPKSALRAFLNDWQGKEMSDMEAVDTDIEEWVGKEGLATVVHTPPKADGTVYANLKAMSPLPEGMTCPPAINKPFILNFQEKWDQAAFEALPQFLKDMIMSSDQYASKFQLPISQSGRDINTEIDITDIPF